MRSRYRKYKNSFQRLPGNNTARASKDVRNAVERQEQTDFVTQMNFVANQHHIYVYQNPLNKHQQRVIASDTTKTSCFYLINISSLNLSIIVVNI